MAIQPPKPFVMSQTSNQWSSGICDCCDNVPECCFSFWCFPCFACVTARKHGECLCLPLLDGFGCIPPITIAMRVSMRRRYGIEGTICDDCLYSTFCGVCAWCQMSREMNVHEQTVTLVNSRAR
ncbi:plac8 onzin related protein 5 [Triplophysa rosa]|uniref:Cornifelin-like protein A n=1 Tax=Triplophysa rosa TaxID=992332 RepID=A0A9W7WQZ4_TRIRA|nr:plac8 onzin related protein 5 [Triplophysa rosa]KAI7806737.1 putative cornifelin-like protein A [Triplophysa rosa]